MSSSKEIAEFLAAIEFHGGTAGRDGLPVATRAQDNARKIAKRRGWVIREAGYWKITSAGRVALKEISLSRETV